MSDDENDILIINDRVRIPTAELQFEFARSSGAGGQHVNKNETAVVLIFDIATTSRLTHDERTRATSKLAGRISGDGLLRVKSQESRSQLKNREEVVTRFAQLLREALIVPKPRRKTKPTRASVERRLDQKRRKSEHKRGRRVDF
jgi:ribosome-associated protein